MQNDSAFPEIFIFFLFQEHKKLSIQQRFAM